MDALRHEQKKQHSNFNDQLNRLKLEAQQVKMETSDLNEYIYGIKFRQSNKVNSLNNI